MSKTINAKFSRLQFTPDLLPADIIGTQIYSPKNEKFSIKKGPIFANFIFLPFAAKLEGISENKEVESALILEGVKLLYDKTHPILMRDKLNAFLESKDRILDEE